MNRFTIFHYDNSSDILDRVVTYIMSLNDDLQPRNIELKLSSFSNHNELRRSLMEKHANPDLLILDMYDDNLKRVGEDVLDTINNLKIKTPVIIYTQGSMAENSVNYYKLGKEFPFIISGPLLKSTSGEVLKEGIMEVIKSKFHVGNLYDCEDDDLFLHAEITALEKNNINDILFDIGMKEGYNGRFILERMSSGFSGAAVFRLKYNNQVKILKITRIKDKLKKEFENAKKMYKRFPRRFRIDIDGTEYENHNVFAILIEEVKMGIPLFDSIKNSHDFNHIHHIFNDLYLRQDGLSQHYKTERINEAKKFTYIFEKLNSMRYSMVKKAIKELKPILGYDSTFLFNENELRSLISNGNYGNIDKEKLLGDQFYKKLILCHGDFHSNNIMVQDNSPVIIDTGGIAYDFWCMDACRLLVNLFIVGFDIDTYAYFDPNRIQENLKNAVKMIKGENLSNDGVNDNFITAINWLLNNVQAIYGDYYSKWEFQLGLLKEFLHASYRNASIPPNKRAICLLAAYQCLLIANQEVKNHS